MEAKYIYGIIEAVHPDTKSFGVGVYTIPYQDISAVLSDSQFVNYTTLPKNQVAKYLLVHQQVIEKIMDSYTIIPMKLGTYAFNNREVEEILSKGYAIFKDVFMKINNKIEIDVVATWNDLNSIIKEIGEGEEIKELKEKLMFKPEGVSSKDLIKMGSLIKNILDKEREKLASEIKDVLGKVSIDSREHGLMDDRMILNIAFLIDKDKKAEFEKRLDELNALYNESNPPYPPLLKGGQGGLSGEKIDFRCVGPLPPYSFYTAEVKKIRFEDIQWAREKLGLNYMAYREEIVKAYRSKANMYHPDKNIGASDTERQFNEINRAYKILLEYCEGDSCSFKEEEFEKNAILVRVRE